MSLQKMVTPAARREAGAHLCQVHEVSQRRACSVIAADRTSVRYRPRRPDDADLRARLRDLAAQRNLESRGVVRLKKGAKGGAFLTTAQHDAIARVLHDMFQVGGISLTKLISEERR